MTKKLKPFTSADQLDSIPSLRVEAMEIPAWGLTVYVRELQASEAGIWREINASLESGQGFSIDNVIDLVMLTACNEAGERILTTPEHRKKLASKQWTVCQAIFLKALAVGRMSADGVESEKKESDQTPSSDLSSD